MLEIVASNMQWLHRGLMSLLESHNSSSLTYRPCCKRLKQGDIRKMYFSHWEPPGVSERMWSENLNASISAEYQTLRGHSGRPSVKLKPLIMGTGVPYEWLWYVWVQLGAPGSAGEKSGSAGNNSGCAGYSSGCANNKHWSTNDKSASTSNHSRAVWVKQHRLWEHCQCTWKS